MCPLLQQGTKTDQQKIIARMTASSGKRLIGLSAEYSEVSGSVSLSSPGMSSRRVSTIDNYGSSAPMKVKNISDLNRALARTGSTTIHTVAPMSTEDSAEQKRKGHEALESIIKSEILNTRLQKWAKIAQQNVSLRKSSAGVSSEGPQSNDEPRVPRRRQSGSTVDWFRSNSGRASGRDIFGSAGVGYTTDDAMPPITSARVHAALASRISSTGRVVESEGSDTVSQLEKVVDLGLEMQRALSDFSAAMGFDISMRIGVSEGKAVGGLMGTVRNRFQIIGPAMSEANKLEHDGVPGFIHMSKEAADKLKGPVSDHHQPINRRAQPTDPRHCLRCRKYIIKDRENMGSADLDDCEQYSIDDGDDASQTSDLPFEPSHGDTSRGLSLAKTDKPPISATKLIIGKITIESSVQGLRESLETFARRVSQLEEQIRRIHGDRRRRGSNNRGRVVSHDASSAQLSRNPSEVSVLSALSEKEENTVNVE